MKCDTGEIKQNKRNTIGRHGEIKVAIANKIGEIREICEIREIIEISDVRKIIEVA